MLDPRIYRAAFVPVVLALIVAAFSLSDRPAPITTTLPADAFDGARAHGPRTGLEALARAYPDRDPGGIGDAGLAKLVAGELRANGFRTSTRSFTADTTDGERTLQTVVGVRAGSSSSRPVVLTHRDAQRGPARAELSGTAALLELARVFSGRRLNRTLVLVSTSGGSAGAAGAEDFARHRGPRRRGARARRPRGHDAAQADRRAVVRRRRRRAAPAPAHDRRGAAHRGRSGAGAARAPGQFARLAFPFTVGEQGVLAEAGLPRCCSRARASAAPTRRWRPTRCASRPTGARRCGRSPRSTRVRPSTAARRLRGHPQARHAGLGGAAGRRDAAAAGARRGGGRARPRAAPARAREPRDGLDPRGCAALPARGRLRACGRPAPVACRPGRRPPALRRCRPAAPRGGSRSGWPSWPSWLRGPAPAGAAAPRASGDPAGPGISVGFAVVFCAVAVLVWLANPFAAAVLLPAVHLWCVWAVSGCARGARSARGARRRAPAAGAGPALRHEHADLGPASAWWVSLQLVGGGHLGVGAIVVWCLLLGCVASFALLVLARRPATRTEPEVTVRGPSTYAGPGSLGGTESALRR